MEQVERLQQATESTLFLHPLSILYLQRVTIHIYIVMLLKLVERRWIPLPLFRGYSTSIENAEGRAGEERSRSK